MTPNETRPLPNAADKAALQAIATRVIQTCPSLQDTAHEVASDLLKKYGITGLDPDKVYFHRFDAAQSSSKAFTGWEHANATPTTSMTLTQLVIQRFRAADQDNADLLDVYAGFYSAGPATRLFNETNEVKLHGNEVLEDFWNINFSSLYLQRLTTFWKDSGSDFRTLAKCNFLIQAVQARDKRQLSDADFQFVTQEVMGSITWPVSLEFLQAHQPGSDKVRTLDFAGYVANNILRFVAPKGRQIVYLPGDKEPFQVLETLSDMHYWIVQRMNEEAERQKFMTHFSLSDRQKIADNITDLMNHLVMGWSYDHHLINQKNKAIGDDAFTWLRDSTKDAMFAEAELSLTSNGDLRKKLWIGYLSAGVKVFGPMSVVGWPVALPLVGASIASMGLNIDQAVNGKTAKERKAGVLGAVLSGIDVLFNLLVLKGPGSLQEVGPEIDAAEAQEMAELKEKTLPTEIPEPAPNGTTAQVQPKPSAQVPDAFKIEVSLNENTLVREPGKFQGTYRLASNPSTAIKLNGNAYYVRFESQLNGRSTWAIIDPANPDGFSGSIPVRLNASGKWEIIPRLGLRGGMNLPTVAGTGTTTEPAPEEWARTPGIHVPVLEDPEMRAWALGGPDLRAQYTRLSSVASIEAGTAPVHPVDELTESLSEFDLAQEDARNNLISDAKAYYRLNPPEPRPPVTSTLRLETSSDLLESVFAEKRGLIVGESQGSIGSKQFLIENMPALAQRGVKTLYLQELLANVNQLDLDTFARTGEMTEELENYLRNLDFKAGNDPAGRFDLLNLVKASNAQRIRVQAIDMSTTYNISKDAAWQTDYQMARSFFASQVIQFNEEAKSTSNWVALVSQENMATFRGYQGISEQTGAASLRIDDVVPGQASPIGSDPGLPVEYADHPDSPVYKAWPEASSDEVQDLIQGDWRLQVETPWAYRSPQDLRALLPEPGMFTIQRYRSSVLVVYRNANNRMADSVIRLTPAGRINLETPLQPAYDSMTVDSFEELKQALIAKGMRPMGWPAEIDSSLAGTSQHSELPTHWQANELLEDRTPVTTPGKDQGIYRLNSNPSTAILLDDLPFYVRYEADINGQGTWAIIDPEHPNAFSGSLPVRLNAEGEWELTPRAGLKGGGNRHPGKLRTPARVPTPGNSRTPTPEPTPATARIPSTQYDATVRLRNLALGVRETHIKLVRQPNGMLWGMSNYEIHVAEKRAKLTIDALLFTGREGLFETLPARPGIPVVTPTTKATELIEKVFDVAPGLVIGESQDRIASMQFLFENMPALAAREVKTLYFHRLLNDFNQADLNLFFTTGEMSDDLEASLRQLQSDPSGQFTPLEVIKAAQRNGIRVQATDCLASYRFPYGETTDVQEQIIKTYLTHTIMQSDQALNGAGKWVVLTDHRNINTFRGVSGISELQNGIGLRVEEVLPEQKLLIETDRGIEVGRGFSNNPGHMAGDSATLYADLNIRMPLPPFTRTPQELERLLFRVSMFTFEHANEQWTLIHHSRNGPIVRTLVERTADGQYLIDRPAWTEVHQVRYASIVEMSAALSRMGMDLQGRLAL
ncbi:MAG: membrane-targeted effector domain-containing toxin [Pseudomonas sp.]|uniref:membrane-targeted effector domain-containing toxin n=1 Tax=Pseudomonas sp. TaxID=306 RepID=UPI003D6F4799